MKESTTYQAILQEGRDSGRAAEARRLILLVGVGRLGEPEAATQAAIEGIEDLARLERMAERLLAAQSWQELLTASE